MADEFSSVVCDAAKNGNVDDLVAALASHPNLIDTPNPKDRTNRTPMFVAAMNGHAGVIEKLIELGSKAIDTPDQNRWTPLYAAARRRHVSAIEALVRLGSNAIDIPDKHGVTPLYAAASNGHVSVIEALVRLGSKAIDTPDHDGWTPLHAAWNGNVSVIEALVRLGSQAIDTPDNNGWTPLYAAAYNRPCFGDRDTCSIGKQGHRHSRQQRLDSRVCCRHVPQDRVLECAAMVGADCSNMSNVGLSEETIRLLQAPMDEDQAAEARYRVFFSQSLVSRLLRLPFA